MRYVSDGISNPTRVKSMRRLWQSGCSVVKVQQAAQEDLSQGGKVRSAFFQYLYEQEHGSELVWVVHKEFGDICHDTRLFNKISKAPDHRPVRTVPYDCLITANTAL